MKGLITTPFFIVVFLLEVFVKFSQEALVVPIYLKAYELQCCSHGRLCLLS